MTDRITVTRLRRLCENMARDIGREGDTFAIDHVACYGGYRLERNGSDLFGGRCSANDLYHRMHAYWEGWRDARREVTP